MVCTAALRIWVLIKLLFNIQAAQLPTAFKPLFLCNVKHSVPGLLTCTLTWFALQCRLLGKLMAEQSLPSATCSAPRWLTVRFRVYGPHTQLCCLRLTYITAFSLQALMDTDGNGKISQEELLTTAKNVMEAERHTASMGGDKLPRVSWSLNVPFH